MLVLGLWMLLAQPACPPGAEAQAAEGARLAAAFNLPEAAERYEAAARQGCDEARIAALYLSGLHVARQAYAAGGSPESLAPVGQAERALEAIAARGNPVAEISRLLLIAASAAAQSERDQMGTLLVHAKALELRQLAAGARAVPGVTAHELAGDLWLQVHRFEDARDAYRDAERIVGLTPRIARGRAMTAERLNDTAGACQAWQAFMALWQGPVDYPDWRRARSFVDVNCATNAAAPGVTRPAARQ